MKLMKPICTKKEKVGIVASTTKNAKELFKKEVKRFDAMQRSLALQADYLGSLTDDPKKKARIKTLVKDVKSIKHTLIRKAK